MSNSTLFFKATIAVLIFQSHLARVSFAILLSTSASGNPKYLLGVLAYADEVGCKTIGITCNSNAKIAEEVGTLICVEDSGIDKMIKSVYSLLKLLTFITAGEKEVRAWTVKEGTKAPQAAGVIHTDFEKGFIRAEVTGYQDFVDNGSYTACKDKGVTRLEGKDYIMQDGDIVHFRFAV